MFDVRNYLVAVCGTFMALGIGILIGISYGEDVLIYHQQEAIQRLEQEIELVQSENRELRSEVDRWEDFQKIFWEEIYSDLEFNEVRAGFILSPGYRSEKVEEISGLLDGFDVEYWFIHLKPGLEASFREIFNRHNISRDKFASKNWFEETYRRLPEMPGNRMCYREKLWLLLEDKGGLSLEGEFAKGDYLFLFVDSPEKKESKSKEWVRKAGEFLSSRDWKTVEVNYGDEGCESVDGEPGFDAGISREDFFWIKLDVMEIMRTG